MKIGTLIKILVFFFTITIFVCYGMHTVIIKNSEDVRESAYDYVNKYCSHAINNNQIIYNESIKGWNQMNVNLSQ